MYEWIIANKELLKIVYALVITFICALIVLKSDRLFKISNYQGLRYFRNAFFFYGIAFVVRFILGSGHQDISQLYCDIIKICFEFATITAGFLLLYSLIWKKVETSKNFHSLLNKNMYVIYIVSIVVAMLDHVWSTSLFMYITQIILFVILIVLSYKNLSNKKKKSPFLKYYFITMILGLLVWILNCMLEFVLNWNKIVQMGVYGLNIVFFLLFLYGALNITKNGKKT